MKKYIGIKKVMAQPMTADEAVAKGYKVGNHEHEDGYEVEYKDGYKSWSPKDVFEEAYKLAETPVDRMKTELAELWEKIQGLSKFIKSDKFPTLDEEIQALLYAQCASMKDYAHLLVNRISKMTENPHGNWVTGFIPFSIAISFLKCGCMVRRRLWEEGEFIVKQIPAAIDDSVIPKMTSLPKSVKDRLMLSDNKKIKYTDQIIMVNGDHEAVSWSPSVSDIFADDWELARKEED